MLLALIACDTGAPPDAAERAPTAEPSVPVLRTAPLDDLALLRRLSLDLRGELPSEAEMARVEADPAAIDALVDEMLASDAFERRFADVVAEQWLTRVDAYNVGAFDLGLDPALDRAFVRDVGNEVPVFLAAVAAQDLPWTDAVTADWTMSTALLSEAWPVELVDGGPASGVEGWSRARYTDGRPPGGVVMTNGLWWRYWSAPNNYNRTRAAAIGRLLLCDDWLTRPIQVEADVSLDAATLEGAVRTQPSCVGCHDTLDPLAAALFGFWWFDLYDPLEMRGYHPEREFLGERYLGTEPAWFGKRMDGPADLGPRIAEDPRFLRCAVQRVAQGLWRRTLDDDDFVAVNALQARFAEGGNTMRALMRAVVETDEYRAGALLDDAPEDTPSTTRRAVQPSQLARMVEQRTGYTWTLEEDPLLGNDELGYRVLAGGVDGVHVALPNEDPSVTRALVTQRLAEAAASFVVLGDLSPATPEPLLLDAVTAEDAPDAEVWGAQLRSLHRRLHGHTATEEEIAEELALADAVYAETGSVHQAWQAVVELLLRDPAFWTY